jgi:uncharacterized membrane protein
MTVQSTAWTDEEFDTLLGNVLRAGVLVAAAVVLCGGVVYLLRHGHDVPDYRVFRGEPSDLRFVSGIVSDARSLSGRGLIQLGLLLLVATPIARVVLSVVGFLKQRNWMYVAFTLVVLMLLTYSLIQTVPLTV